MATDSLPILTVLICTHNRSDLLSRALASINNAERPNGWRLNILVVANACTDDTHNVLGAYQEYQGAEAWLALTWLADPVAGKSHALNTGLAAVEADLIIFADDDQTVSEDFLVNVCAEAERHPDVSMFCGRILPAWRGDEPPWIRKDGPYRIYPCPIPHYDLGDEAQLLNTSDFLPGGGNLILRSGVLERTGIFSTTLGPKGHNLAGGEDTAFVKKALFLGERLVYAPKIVQFHFVDQNRLTTNFLIKFAYQRTAAAVSIDPPLNRIPIYVWRKLINNVASTLFTLSGDKRRFYLVRTAATLGEIKGFAIRMFRNRSRNV